MPDASLPPEPSESRRHLRVLQRYGRWLLVAVALPVAAALVFNALAAPVYEATATMAIVSADTTASTATARALLSSRHTATRVIDQFKLSTVVPGLTPDAFLRDVLRVDEVRGTKLLRVSVRLPDPVLAARVVNRFVQLAAELEGTVEQSEEEFDHANVKAQLDDVAAALQDAQRRLLALKANTSSRTPVLERRLEVESLAAEVAALKNVYTRWTERYYESRALMIDRRAALRVADRALPPSAPVFPRAGRLVGIALVAGIVLSLVITLTIDALRAPISHPSGRGTAAAAPLTRGSAYVDDGTRRTAERDDAI